MNTLVMLKSLRILVAFTMVGSLWLAWAWLVDDVRLSIVFGACASVMAALLFATSKLIRREQYAGLVNSTESRNPDGSPYIGGAGGTEIQR